MVTPSRWITFGHYTAHGEIVVCLALAAIVAVGDPTTGADFGNVAASVTVAAAIVVPSMIAGFAHWDNNGGCTACARPPRPAMPSSARAAVGFVGPWFVYTFPAAIAGVIAAGAADIPYTVRPCLFLIAVHGATFYADTIAGYHRPRTTHLTQETAS